MRFADRWTSYDVMSQHLEPAATLLVDRVAVAGGPLLDVGSGTGNGLRVAAARSVPAVGVDVAMAQVREAGAERSRSMCGDGARLPVRSASVACAISNFALIFASEPSAVASEMLRCIRPRGSLGFTAWCPNGWPDRFRAVLGPELDTPPSPFPTALAEPRVAASMLESAGAVEVEVRDAELSWRFESFGNAVEVLTGAAGGMRLARRQLEASGRWPSIVGHLENALVPVTREVDGGIVVVERYVVATAKRVGGPD